MTAHHQKLKGILETLNELISAVKSLNYDETAQLLCIARLDLLTRANDISSEELEALVYTMKRAAVIQQQKRPIS